MNNFCLGDSLHDEFETEVVFVSKKKEKKLVHMSLVKLLTSCKFFKEIINFVRIYWNKRKKFYPRYFFLYPKP